MITKPDLDNRLKTTQLKVFQKTEWVAGNSSLLIQKIIQSIDFGIDFGVTTGGSVYSARTAAIDVAHAAEDYACSDYKCLMLDCVAAGCDFAATGISFVSKTNTTRFSFVFAGCTATSKFARTLRNQCKAKNLFNCK